MQILPQFDPWGQFGQQLGSGIGNYLQQATDRARFTQNLSAAQQLLQPTQGPNGEVQQRSPAELLFGLYQASGGNPAFLQTIGEIYPHLIKENTRQAGIAALNNQNKQPQRLPNGNVPNRPPRGAPQQAEPYNEQPYAMETGAVGPGNQEVPQDRLGRNQIERQDVDESPQDQPGGQFNEYLEPFGPQHPEWETMSPEQERNIKLTYLNNASTLEEAQRDIQGKIQGMDKRNEARTVYYNNKRADQAAARQLSAEQNTFLNGELASRGWDKDPFYEAFARREFLKNQANPDLKTDIAKWEPVREKMEKLTKTKTNLSTAGVGRSFPWQNYDDAYRQTRASTQAFLNSAGFRRPDGTVDESIGDQAIDALMGQDWSRTEATSLTYPLSKGILNLIRKAPEVNGKFGTPLENKEHTLLQVAKRFYEEVKDHDSLLVMRDQLNLQHEYNEGDFDKILALAEGMGWEPSSFQDGELGLLRNEITPSLTEVIFGGKRFIQGFLHKRAGKL